MEKFGYKIKPEAVTPETRERLSNAFGNTGEHMSDAVDKIRYASQLAKNTKELGEATERFCTNCAKYNMEWAARGTLSVVRSVANVVDAVIGKK